jgi:hypothetical protein
LTYGGFVIGSQGRETSEGAKIALQIDFELNSFKIYCGIYPNTKYKKA